MGRALRSCQISEESRLAASYQVIRKFTVIGTLTTGSSYPSLEDLCPANARFIMAKRRELVALSRPGWWSYYFARRTVDLADKERIET
jgi:hypothetical protein